MRKRNVMATVVLGLLLVASAAGAASADDSSGRHSVWREGCGPYGHRGPSGGCIPGGRFGAGNYYFLGPDYHSSWDFVGPPAYGGSAPAGGEPDYGVGYWGTRPYNIPAFQ